jgi:predicted amidophosphoribosyltransferase
VDTHLRLHTEIESAPFSATTYIVPLALPCAILAFSNHVRESPVMKVNIEEIKGPWDLGFSLDKHVVSSTYIGDDDYGQARFDTTRSEVGEALFQLKYRSDLSQVDPIATLMVTSLQSRFKEISFVLPMPPSKHRKIQPVLEIAKQVAGKLGRSYVDNLLVKTGSTPQMKDIPTKEEKLKALTSALVIKDVLPKGVHNVLLVDDLYDSGSSLEVASRLLRGYPKVGHIFVATATRRR